MTFTKFDDNFSFQESLWDLKPMRSDGPVQILYWEVSSLDQAVGSSSIIERVLLRIYDLY